MNELLKKNAVKFIIISFPLSEQVNDENLKLNKDYVLYPQKRLRNLCNNYKIPFLDLTDAIYRNGGTSLFNDYLHLNPSGNDVVAHEVTDYLYSFLYNSKPNPQEVK